MGKINHTYQKIEHYYSKRTLEKQTVANPNIYKNTELFEATDSAALQVLFSKNR